MSSVTERISQIKQPYGGYIKPAEFKEIVLNDEFTLNNENISPMKVGTVVDYMTRLMMGDSVYEAFEISYAGAKIAAELVDIPLSHAEELMTKITGLDDESIISACKLVGFDVWVRRLTEALEYRSSTAPDPDKETIENIRIMVNRGLKFFKEYGPVTKFGFTFEKPGTVLVNKKLDKPNGGYTETVDSGDGDFLTADTLWDFKVTKNKITSKHTLQLLMYYIMGQHSGQEIYRGIRYLGVFNPRLNRIYKLGVDEIPLDIIKTVEKEVIGY